MNKIYRLIWNEITRTWVAVAENARACGKRASGAVLLAASGVALAAPPAPGQLPGGGQVVAGSASIGQAGAVMNINQSSQRAAIDWQTFNVGSAASVNFNQPSAASVTLNRVLDSNPSQIFGRITAPGQVFLTNPGGVYFAPGASVDVGALVATTHGISNADFMAGNDRFTRNGATGSISNEGNLTANFSPDKGRPGGVGGYIALLAPEVRNQGVIVAQLGTVALAAGETYTLQFADGRLAGIQVEPATLQALVDNRQAVAAPGGLIILSALAADSLQGGVVQNSGSLAANSLTEKGGRILLEGDAITLASGSRLDASGATGGGEVLAGGGWQGSGSMHQAATVTMEQGATIDVSATQVGAGGTAVLWSDVTNANSQTRAYGTIWARGGAEGGDGGRIETSGHWLDVAGSQGGASATNGKAGEWLFDPYSVTITSANANGSFTSGTWTPSGNSSTILNTDINALLEGGTSVTVTTGAAGTQIGDITVSSAITKSTGNTDVTLTMQAANSIVVDQAISNTGGSGKLHVVLDADNNSGTGDGAGIVLLNNDISTGGGNLQFGTGRTATINSVSTLVGGDVYVAGAGARSLTTGGGNVTVNGEMILANTSGLTIITSNGNVSFGGLLNSGNSYTGVSYAGTWSQALTNAASGGGGGTGDTYLATITSRLENAIASRTVNYDSSWLGGRRKMDIGTNAVWRWVTGPEGLEDSGNGRQFFTQVSTGSGGSAINGSYSNWNAGEPNNCYGGTCNGSLNTAAETALQFTGSTGVWNDLNEGSGASLNKYVKETNLAASPLTISAGAGTVTFSGAVGGSKALASLNVTAGTIAINGGAVTSEGAQTYTGAVTTGAAATLTASSITTSSTIAASSYALTLSTDNLTLGGNVSGTGALTIKPVTAGATIGIAGGAGTLSLPASYFSTNFVNGFSGVTVGSATAGAITLGGATTLNDSTTLQTNSTIAIGGAVTANENLTLQSNGAITQSQAVGVTGTTSITAGTNNVTLSNTSNNFGGAVSVVSAQNLSLIDSNAMTLGAVTSTGTVDVATLTNDLTLTGAISTTNATASAITLNAGKTTGAGTATGGNLIVSGGSISVGSGGSATLYTGSVSGSTGLTTLIGSGSGRFRYNSDESASNYTTALGTGNYAVYREQPTATITAGNQSVTYGEDPTPTTSFSGQNGDTAAQALSTAATVAVNGSTLTPSGAASGLGYALSYVNGQLSVNPAALTITANAASKTYDGLAYSGGNGVTYSGFVSGETAAVLGGTLTYSGTSQGAINAGSYLITPGGKTSGNYTISYTNGTLTVNQKALAISGSSADKIYDGTTTATVTAGTLLGLVGSETLNVSGSGSFADKNVGSGKNVSVSYSLTDGTNGGLASNYTLAGETLTANITMASLTVTANAASKTYDGLAYSGGNGVAYSGFVNGETSAVLGGTLAYSGTSQGAIDAGSYIIATGGLTSGNYTISYASGALTVNQAALTVTTNAASKTYDGLAYSGGNGVTYSGFVNSETAAVLGGTLAYSGTSQNAINAGSYIITPAGQTAGNYTLSYTNGTLTVNQKALTASITASSKTYDGTTTAVPTFTITGGLVGTETVTATGTATFDSKDVGTGKTVTATGNTLADGANGGLASNYSLSTGQTTTADITTASLTVTANAASKTYDGLAYSGGNGVAYSGFVNGETSAVLGGTLAYSGDSQGAINAGSYLITPAGQTSGNYTLSYTNGTLTVNQKALTASITASSKVYDGTTTATPTFTITGGLVGTETVTATGTGTFDSKDVGTGRTVTATGNTLADGVNGGLASNYSLGTGQTTTADITRASLTVTANAASKTYDGLAYSGGNGVTYTGLVNNEAPSVLGGTLGYTGTSQGASDLGIYSITPGGLTSGNYTINYADGMLIINQLFIPLPPSVGPQHSQGSTVVPSSPLLSDQGESTGTTNFGASGESGDSMAVTTTTREGITISLVRAPSDQMAGVVTVSLPKGTATDGNGFTFPLPEQVAVETTNNTTVHVTTASGGALPSWLRYIPKTKMFVATAVPDGALPIQLVVTIGTQQTTLVISERVK